MYTQRLRGQATEHGGYALNGSAQIRANLQVGIALLECPSLVSFSKFQPPEDLNNAIYTAAAHKFGPGGGIAPDLAPPNCQQKQKDGVCGYTKVIRHCPDVNDDFNLFSVNPLVDLHLPMISSKQQAHSSAAAMASFISTGTIPSLLRSRRLTRRATWAAMQQPTMKPALIPNDSCNVSCSIEHSSTFTDNTKMLQRFFRPRFIKLPLAYCAGSRRHNANTPATEPATATSSALKTATTKKLAVENGFTDWRPIYQLPLIRWIAAFIRLKNYQAAVTVAATPLAFTLSQAGQVSGEAIGICASLGVSGLITLSLGSYLTSNIIGFIYINDHQDQLRLAYVDFWGRRQEALVDIEDILPDWELKRTTRMGFYQPICLRTDKKQRFKILQRFGVITDPLIFEGLFGQ